MPEFVNDGQVHLLDCTWTEGPMAVLHEIGWAASNPANLAGTQVTKRAREALLGFIAEEFWAFYQKHENDCLVSVLGICLVRLSKLRGFWVKLFGEAPLVIPVGRTPNL